MSATGGRETGGEAGESSTTAPATTGATENASGRAAGGARASGVHRLAQTASAPVPGDKSGGNRAVPWWKGGRSVLDLLPSRRARAHAPLKRVHLGHTHSQHADPLSRQDSSLTMTTISESTGLKEENWLWAAIKSWMPTASAQMRRAPAIVKLQAFFKFSFEQFETEESTLQDAEDETRRFILDMQDRAEEVAAEQQGEGDGAGDGPASGRPSAQLRQGGGAEGDEAGAPGNGGAAGDDHPRGEVAIGLSTAASVTSSRGADLEALGPQDVAASSGSEAERGSGSPLAGDQLDSPPTDRHSHQHQHHHYRARRSGSGSGRVAAADEAAESAERGSRASARSARGSDDGGARAGVGASAGAEGQAEAGARRRSGQRRFTLDRVSEVLAASHRFSDAAANGALSAVAQAVAPAAGLVKAVGEELRPGELMKDMTDVATAFGAGPGLKVHYYLAPSVSNYLRVIFLDPVHPNSMFKVLWDFLYLPINTWILLVSPILIVFVDNIRVTTPLGRFEFAIDLLCMLDVLMYLRTAILCDDFRVKAGRSVIARNYMRTWGVLDLLACIPFLTLINLPSSFNQLSRTVLCFRLTRLTKMLRMPHIIASNNVNAYLEAKVFKRKGLVPLLVLLTALFVTMHHMACYYYYVGVVYTENFTLTDVNSWVLVEGLQDMKGGSRYMVSLYFTMYTFLTVGYGDVAVVNIVDKIWAIATAVVGIVMVGWFMGAVAAYMGGTGGMEAELAQKRQDVFQFIRKRRIRSHTARKLRRYHDSSMGRSLGDNDLQVIQGLPRVLRTEVTLTLYADTVKKVPFMQTRPPQFVVDLLLRLKTRLYDKGEYVVHEGEIGREIFFLSVGELCVQREVLPEPDTAEAQPRASSRRPKGGRKVVGTMISRIFSRAAPTGVARLSSRAGGAAPVGPLGGPVLPAAAAVFATVTDRAASVTGSLAHGTDTATATGTPAGATTPERGATPPKLTPTATPRHLTAAPGAPAAPAAPGAGPAPALHTTTTTFALPHAASAPVTPGGIPAPAAQAGGAAGGKPGRRAGKLPRQDVLLNVVSSVPPPVYLPGVSRPAPTKGRADGRHAMYPVLVPIGTIKPGGHFGFASCLLGLPRLNSVVAAIPCEVLVLVREDVDALIADWPDIFEDDDLQPHVARQRSFCLRPNPLIRADSMAYQGADRFGGPRGVIRAEPPAGGAGEDGGAGLQSWQPPSAPPLTLAPQSMQRQESSAAAAVTPWAGAGAGSGKALPAKLPSPVPQLPRPPQAGGDGGARDGKQAPAALAVSASARVAPAALPAALPAAVAPGSRAPAVMISTSAAAAPAPAGAVAAPAAAPGGGEGGAAAAAAGGGAGGGEVELSGQQRAEQQP
ncbi:hypothetical protein HXX76_007007 [Chlamydomonas incerta]|uniref:Cyclic nucleotide-binding domain-containing protein n=1 Tax=Chlamydomonas incerta TaxID=51695 RepID=A0A835T1W0_CHLIN|nr:hypothetical protein HXX76_007007 [Chlamydomonas incerta]|eukprot:KAG2435811.1 hypothetical protein HXX76_007007 [Chlamydomonas incerta]